MTMFEPTHNVPSSGLSTWPAHDASTPQGKEVLELQRATKFVPTKAENYKGIETAAGSAGLLK